MMKKSKLMHIALFLFLAAGATGQELVHKEWRYEATLRNTYPAQAGGWLQMKRVRGTITVDSWKKNEVAVTERVIMDVFTEAEAAKILDAVASGYGHEGNTVTIQGGGRRGAWRRNFEITVPQEFNLKLDNRGGRISVKGVHGESDISTSGGDIELRQMAGEVRLRTSGGALLLKDIRGDISGRTSGGDIELESMEGKVSLRTSGGNISVDGSKSELELRTSGGNVRLQNVDGSVDAATSGGEIRVSQCRAVAELSTSGGDIVLEDVLAKMTAHTSGGDIRGRQIDAALEVSTSGGDIRLENLRAPAKARTSGGDIAVTVALTDFQKPHGLELRTSAGEIRCLLPQKLPATITAEIRLDRWGRSWRRYDIYSDFPLSKEMKTEDGRRVLRAAGEINGGGDRILLSTSAGDIHIKRRK